MFTDSGSVDSLVALSLTGYRFLCKKKKNMKMMMRDEGMSTNKSNLSKWVCSILRGERKEDEKV